MSEYQEAIRIADRVLDGPSLDPDADLAIVARQFLRRAKWELIETHDPAETRSCLVWVPSNRCTYTAVYREGHWWIFGSGHVRVSTHAGEPTHWMPLPEPPVEAPQPRAMDWIALNDPDELEDQRP